MKNNSGDRPPVKYDVEFRAMECDSWYAVNVAVNGDTMTVKYEGYNESFDVKFLAGDFKSGEEIEEFAARFRNISPQMQDSECASVKEGMIVCAACNAFGKDDMLFYDAVVEAMHNESHSFHKGGEECRCTFVLCWRHGPKKDYLTTSRIEGICIIKGKTQVDPRVASFLKLANQKLRKSSCKSTSTFGKDSSASKGSSHDRTGKFLSSTQKSDLSFMEISNVKDMVDMRSAAEAVDFYSNGQYNQDEDLGVQRPNYYLMLVENLERNLLPSSLRDFVHEHSSVSSQVFILPCPSHMPYSRGIIMVDCESKLQKILQFLDNPTHLVVSSKGRPLIVSEKNLRDNMFIASLGSLLNGSQDICDSKRVCQELLVVHLGSEAYRRANQAKDLCLEFMNHQQRLYKKLTVEERAYLQRLQIQPSSYVH